MAFRLPLSRKLANAGWKAKIQDKESREAPHVTMWFKNKKKWRLNLRNGRFMGAGSWNEINEEVREAVEANWQRLRDEWDDMYGDVNPISSEEEDDG
ncbi:MAG TPA: hypothetical protein VG013_36425 [Gemmataceae bacterium]|nr:hypothetical protein [Gemmataceae bacterium]